MQPPGMANQIAEKFSAAHPSPLPPRQRSQCSIWDSVMTVCSVGALVNRWTLGHYVIRDSPGSSAQVRELSLAVFETFFSTGWKHFCVCVLILCCFVSNTNRQ